MSKFLLNILFWALFLGLGIFNSTSANADDRNNLCNTGGSLGENQAMFTLESLRPFASVPVNGVLGTASISTAIHCSSRPSQGGRSKNFVLQLYPGTAETGTVCSTPLDGIGIRYKSSSGKYIACNHWGEIFRLENVKAGQTASFSFANAIEFIRTKTTTNLQPGLHDLQLPATTTINAYWPTITDGDAWGHYSFAAHTQLLVSSCSLSDIPTTVDFKNITWTQIKSGSVEQPFFVKIGGCGDQATAEYINQAASFRFSSAMVLADGSLGNEVCGVCAKGVAIDILQEGGARVNLNQIYKLNQGDFTFSGDSVTHHFRARLKATSSPASVGAIKSMLIVIITTI